MKYLVNKGSGICIIFRKWVCRERFILSFSLGK